MTKSNWPFSDPSNVATITVRQIFNANEPILLVAHDADDRGWQFLTGETFKVADGMLVGLGEMLKHDATLAELADLKLGWQATRTRVGAPWKRSKSE